MWSGRFREPLDAEFEAWQRSIVFDWRLLDQEVAASKAHASALCAAGILTKAETAELREALDAIAAENSLPKRARRWCAITHPPKTFITSSSSSSWSASARSASSCTPAAAATSRSPPTCASTCARKSSSSSSGLAAWASALVEQARAAGDAVMPSYTHLQRAEPVLVAHWLLAYVEMALRDADRLLDCAARLNFCPLGSGAVAGATLALDRTIAARELGFTAPTANSMDATSDRDFILEYLQRAHIRRPAPEPLCRGDHAVCHCGIRFCHSARSIFHGLERHAAEEEPRSDRVDSRQSRPHSTARRRPWPCSSKGCLWPTIKTCRRPRSRPFPSALCRRCCNLVARFTAAIQFNRDRMGEAAESGYLNAMAAATYLVHKGVPFRTAHEKIGRAVRFAIEKGVELDGLTLDELRQFGEEFGEDFYAGDHSRRHARLPRCDRRNRARARAQGARSRLGLDSTFSKNISRGGHSCWCVRRFCTTPPISTTW